MVILSGTWVGSLPLWAVISHRCLSLSSSPVLCGLDRGPDQLSRFGAACRGFSAPSLTCSAYYINTPLLRTIICDHAVSAATSYQNSMLIVFAILSGSPS